MSQSKDIDYSNDNGNYEQPEGVYINNVSDRTLNNHLLTYRTATDVIDHVVLPVICAFGLVGLILTLVVLSKKHMVTSTNCYLSSLAGADFVFLLLLATSLIEPALEPDSRPHYTFQIYTFYANIMMHTLLMASIWSTVMLAVERYIAICQPFLVFKVCSVVKARIVISCIYVSSFLLRLPNFWEKKVVSFFDTNSNITWTFHQARPLADDFHYNTVYPWMVDGVLASIVPFLLLLCLNARLIFEVRKSTQYLKRTGQTGTITAQKEEHQVTVMLIAVILVYFACQGPYVIYTAVVSINLYTLGSSYTLLFKSTARLLLTVKSALNFILYCWFSEKFRATLKKILRDTCPHAQCQPAVRSGSYSNIHDFRRGSGMTALSTIMVTTRDTAI